MKVMTSMIIPKTMSKSLLFSFQSLTVKTGLYHLILEDTLLVIPGKTD